MNNTKLKFPASDENSKDVGNTRRISSRILGIVLVSSTLTIMAGSVIAPVLNLLRNNFGLDPASVGVIITAHGLFIAVFSPVFGVLIDRFGPKKIFVFGLALYGVAGGSGLFIEDYWLLLISRAALGIGVAAFFNSITVLILNLYKGNIRNKIMGWRSAGNSLGGVIWPLLGGFLGTLSWHFPFGIYLVGIPLSILGLIFIPEVKQEKYIGGIKEVSLLNVFKNNKIILAIYGLIFLAGILLTAQMIFLPPFLEMIGISNPFLISLFISLVGIFAGFTSLLYGKIKSKISYKTIILISLGLHTAEFTLLSQTSSLFLIVGAVALAGIGLGLVAPTFPLWAGELAPQQFRGRILSYLGTSVFLGQFVTPIFFAPVLTILGISGIFLIAGGVSAVIFVLLLLFFRK